MDSATEALLKKIDADADAALESLSLWQYGPVEALWASLEASFRALVLFSLEHDQGTPEYGAYRKSMMDWLDIVSCRCAKHPEDQWRVPDELPLDAVSEAMPVLQAYSEVRWSMPHTFHDRVRCEVSGDTVSINFVGDYDRRRRARMIAAERAAVVYATRGSNYDELNEQWSRRWSQAVGGLEAVLANEDSRPVYELPEDLHVLTRQLGDSTFRASGYLDEIARANGTTSGDLHLVVGWLASWSIRAWHAYRDSVRRVVAGRQARHPSCPGVRLVKRADFIARVVLETAVPEVAACFFTDICTTTTQAGHILAQPLVGFQADGTDWLLLSPSLIQSSWFQLSLPAAAEKAGKIPGSVRDTKKAFAEEIASLLVLAGWSAGTDFRYSHDGRDGEIDVLCVDPSTREALVIECKDLMPVHSPGTLRSVDGEPDRKKPGSKPTNLTKGIQQALDGVRFVEADWQRACALAGISPAPQAPAWVAPLVVARWNIGSHALDDQCAPVVVLAQIASGLERQGLGSPRKLWDWLNAGAGADLDAAVVGQVDIRLGSYAYQIPCVHLPESPQSGGDA